MENPEAVFDYLSIRSMRERYYGSNCRPTISFNIPPPSAKACDVSYLANQEALEHFVQDFAIDDSISDCFAETDIGENCASSAVQAPSLVEKELLTPPKVSKQTPKAPQEPDHASRKSGKPSTSKTKVTFVLDSDEQGLSSAENNRRKGSESTGQNLKQTHPGATKQKSVNLQEKSASIPTSQSNQPRFLGTMASAHEQCNLSTGANKENSKPQVQTEFSQAHSRFRSRSKSEDSVKASEKEKESTNSRNTKFSLSWVIDNTINRNKKYQQNVHTKRVVRNEQNQMKKLSGTANSTMIMDRHHDNDHAIKDFTITSIGVVQQNDDEFDELIIAHHKNSHPSEAKDSSPKMKPRFNSYEEEDDFGQNYSSIIKKITNNSQKQTLATAGPSNKEKEKEPGNGVSLSLEALSPRKTSASVLSNHLNPDSRFIDNVFPPKDSTIQDGCARQPAPPPWYKSSSFADVIGGYTSSPPFRPMGKSFTPLSRLIDKTAESNADSEKDINSIELPSLVVDKCLSNDNIILTNSGNRNGSKNNVQSIDTGISGHRKMDIAAQNISTLKSSLLGKQTDRYDGSVLHMDADNGNNDLPLKNTFLHDASSHGQANSSYQGSEGSKNEDLTHRKEKSNTSTNQVSALELLCRELLWRCGFLEQGRERLLSCLQDILSGPLALLLKVSRQLSHLVPFTESLVASSPDARSQLSQIAMEVSSAVSKLRALVASTMEDTAPVEESFDETTGRPNLQDNLFRSLTKATIDMFENGLHLQEIHQNLRLLVMTGMRTTSHSTSLPASSIDVTNDTLYPQANNANEFRSGAMNKTPEAYNSLEPDSARSAAMQRECTRAKETSVLSPEEHYPPPSLSYFKQKQNLCPVDAGFVQSMIGGKSLEVVRDDEGTRELKEQTKARCSSSVAQAARTRNNFLVDGANRMAQRVEAAPDVLDFTTVSATPSANIIGNNNRYHHHSVAHVALSTPHHTSDITAIITTDRTDSRSCKNSHGGKHRRRRSHSLSRLHHMTGSSDIVNDSSSAGEGFETSASRSESTNKSRASRGRPHRRRSHSALRHRRNASCHSYFSDDSRKYSKTSLGNHATQKEKLEVSRHKGTQKTALRKGSNSHQRFFASSRSASARLQRGRMYGSWGDCDTHDDLGVKYGGDDYDDDDDYDEDDESTKVRVNVPHEDFSDDGLRVQRLKQHLQSVHKLRQRNRDVIETIITGTGERLGPRKISRDPHSDQTHVNNVGEAYPFRSQKGQDGSKEQPRSPPLPSTNAEKLRESTGVKILKPFKGKLGTKIKSRLFNNEQEEGSTIQARELTESEFEETFERRNDVTVRRRREMDAGIPWDELEFSGRESDATLGWSDG
ncbi:hypothetical protein PoB_000773100 [Plakobranchus ocellatus]|uniref:Uncharacterized protein n=1 Tax=Plakobranchus ocellatus TaxID=259542 RepID=A0AAV3YDH1_9GAST|nr:hypothetical protein PoB_000773100 [Plakobranchus ocellatus]